MSIARAATPSGGAVIRPTVDCLVWHEAAREARREAIALDTVSKYIRAFLSVASVSTARVKAVWALSNSLRNIWLAWQHPKGTRWVKATQTKHNMAGSAAQAPGHGIARATHAAPIPTNAVVHLGS